MFDRNRIVVAALCFLLLPSAAGGTFTASPMEFHLAAEAGTRGTGSITLRNTGDRQLTLKLYLSDYSILADGSEENLPPGTLARSCAPWLALTDQILELEPGEVRRVVIGLDVPHDAEGSYWAKMYIEETSQPQPSETRMGGRTYQVFLMQRVGIRIFEDVPGTENVDARITNVAVSHDDEGRPLVLVSVSNTGNMLLRCSGSVELRNSGGTVAETLLLGTEGKFSVFTDGKRELSAAIDMELEADTYTALAVVDFGGDHLVAGDAVFRVTSEGLLPGLTGPGSDLPPSNEREDQPSCLDDSED